MHRFKAVTIYFDQLVKSRDLGHLQIRCLKTASVAQQPCITSDFFVDIVIANVVRACHEFGIATALPDIL